MVGMMRTTGVWRQNPAGRRRTRSLPERRRPGRTRMNPLLRHLLAAADTVDDGRGFRRSTLSIYEYRVRPQRRDQSDVTCHPSSRQTSCNSTFNHHTVSGCRLSVYKGRSHGRMEPFLESLVERCSSDAVKHIRCIREARSPVRAR